MFGVRRGYVWDEAGYVWGEAYLSFRMRCSVTFFTYSRSMFLKIARIIAQSEQVQKYAKFL